MLHTRSWQHESVGHHAATRTYLANLRHELRTPLNAIIGYSEMILEDAADAAGSVLEPLQQIRRSGSTLLTLVNTLLDASKIADGTPEAPIADLCRQMDRPLDDVLAQTQTLIADAQTLWVNQFLDDLQKIREAGVRLLKELAELKQRGPRTIEVNQPRKERASGMSDHVRFMRPSTAPVRAGPLCGRVLVVDDIDMNRDVLQRRLQSQGHQVTLATSGAEALTLVAEQSFDLILLDILMPQMSGMEVLQRLKDDPQAQRIPVVMISALDEMENIIRSIEIGAEDYLAKPFEPALLRASVGSCLEKKWLRDREVELLYNILHAEVILPISDIPFLRGGLALKPPPTTNRILTRMDDAIPRPPNLPRNIQPQSISALTAQIKSMLEENFAAVWVVGEIGSLTVAGSGHAYFTLKDQTAILPSVMWRNVAQRHRYALKEGTEVIVRGKLTVYLPHGKYQLSVDELYQKGAGAQELALKQLKEKLHQLGYFTAERKRPLPAFPRRLALVASTTGAAIRDMLEISARRWPSAEIWIAGVRVQGAGSPEEIAAALDRLNQFAGIDAIILGRGGGSSEDLAAFNTEIVARAIFASKIPVVSAVGHEIDVTIADLVADVRANTPSEAAELATPDRAELLVRLRSHRQRLYDLLLGRFEASKQRLAGVAQRRVFLAPLERVRDQERRLDDWDERLCRVLQFRMQKERQRIDAFAGKLESLSPLNVLARGYSLTRSIPAKEVVCSIDQVEVGQTVEILLHDGQLQAQIQAKESRSES